MKQSFKGCCLQRVTHPVMIMKCIFLRLNECTECNAWNVCFFDRSTGRLSRYQSILYIFDCDAVNRRLEWRIYINRGVRYRYNNSKSLLVQSFDTHTLTHTVATPEINKNIKKWKWMLSFNGRSECSGIHEYRLTVHSIVLIFST